MLAFGMYQWRKLDPDKLAEKVKPFYQLSYNKWYVDEIYQSSFIAGTLGLSRIMALFDNKIVDGIVNGTAYVTRQFSNLNGLFDKYVVDGLVNFSAFISGVIGLGFRKLQTGKVQTYLVFVIFSVVILVLVFRPF
jgi:NADH-quinone oxidoreductase subunit L